MPRPRYSGRVATSPIPANLGVGTRRHNPARPSQRIAISLEENDVTIVIGFFAEEDPDGYVRVFSPEYILPEVEELAD